jgi:DNA-binding transcriptional MerR regulator
MGDNYRLIVFVDKLRRLGKGVPLSAVESVIRENSVTANNNAGAYKVTMRQLTDRLTQLVRDMEERLRNLKEKNQVDEYDSVRADLKQFDILYGEGGKAKRTYVEKQADFFVNWPDIARDRISSRDHSKLGTYITIRDKLIRETTEPLKALEELKKHAKALLTEAERTYQELTRRR